MKNIIFAILLVLPSAFFVESKSEDEAVFPLSLCWIINSCKEE